MMAIALTEPVGSDEMVAWQRVKIKLKNISEFQVGIESKTDVTVRNRNKRTKFNFNDPYL